MNHRRRGWVAFGSGVFLVVFMGIVAIWVDRLLSANGLLLRDATAAQFAGRMNVVFTLVIVAGVLGIINGWTMAHSGRQNKILVVGFIILVVAALFVGCSASRMYPT